MIKTKRNKRGFTLGEMVVTIAIVGSITAIAIPNYMRVRMHVNMEMVKQHLKTIGTHMNDLYNRDKQFPQNISPLGSSGEEVSITASLFGIDGREYTTNDYTTGPSRSTYRLRSCPKAGRWGIAGDRCFVLTPLGISEDPAGGSAFALNPWDGTNVPMIANNSVVTGGLITRLLSDWRLTESEKIDILIDLFAKITYWSELVRITRLTGVPFPDWPNNLPAANVSIIKGELAKLDKYLPKIDAALRAQGVQFYITDHSVGNSYPKIQGRTVTTFMFPPVTAQTVQIAVASKVDNPMTVDELLASSRGNKVRDYLGTLV